MDLSDKRNLLDTIGSLASAFNPVLCWLRQRGTGFFRGQKLMTVASEKEKLERAIDLAKLHLREAEDALAQFCAKAENNVFETLDDALCTIEEVLRDKARADCEGSYNCGNPEYTQAFMVSDVEYVGTLKVEYDRHDKTYYYVDSAKFSYAKR